MKILAAFLLLGFALSSAISLHPVEHDLEVESAFNEVFQDLKAEEDFDVGKLKEKFDELVKKVKDAFEQGKTLKDALEKLQQIRETFKDLNIDLGEKGREYLEILKEKVKEYWKKLKEKLVSKRNSDIEFFAKLEELKEMLEKGVDAEGLKTFVEQIFGNGSSNELTEHFFKLLDEGPSGRQKLIDWIDRVIGEKDE